jgi:hypothetical protein
MEGFIKPYEQIKKYILSQIIFVLIEACKIIDA